jgi:acetylornithine deacetylase
MTVDPFGGTIDKGRLYGRGACDIKGGMAAMLGALTRLVRDRPAGAARILMACTVDEEHTFLGVQQLVSGGLQADLAVVAEPTSLNIVKAHKGVCRWHVVTQGLACHSSAPEQGINAIYRMGRLLEPIERYAEELRTRKVDPLLGPATLSIGRIEGGLSVNTVPDWCRIEVDRRLTPGEVPQAAQEEFTAWLRAAVPKDVPFTCLPLWMTCPALAPGGSEELVAQLGRCIDAVVGRHQVLAVPFGTDASTVAQAVIPTVVFGPGNIAQAHTCDEWVSLDEVEQASEILYRLVCEG